MVPQITAAPAISSVLRANFEVPCVFPSHGQVGVTTTTACGLEVSNDSVATTTARSSAP